MPQTARQRSASARHANQVRLSRLSPEQRTQMTAAALEGQLRWYADQVDPDRQLTPEELDARVRERRRERMTALSRRAHEARRAARAVHATGNA